MDFLKNLVVGAAALAMMAGIAEARTLSYTTSGNPSEPATKVFIDWAEDIKAKSNGELEIEFYFQESLSKLGDNLSAIGDGLADMGTVVPAYSRQDMPLTYLSSTAVGSGDPYAVNEAWIRTREAFPQIAAEDEKNNVRFLVNSSIGPVVLIGNKHYTSPQDFGGASMRLSSHFARAAAVHGWKVNPTRIQFPEMYTALEKGTITGGSAYTTQIKPYGLQEVAQYGTILNLGQHMNHIYINLDTWNDLEDAERQVIEESLPKLRTALSRAMIDQGEADLEALKSDPKNPMKIMKLPADARSEWAKQMAVSQDEGVAKVTEVNPIAPKISEFYLDNVDKIAAEVEKNGYPWQ